MSAGNPKDDIRARLLETFRVEAEEHLGAIASNLAALERGLPADEAREVLEATFREVHTLKGAARSVALTEVEALCQASESVLSRVTRGNLAFRRPILAGLQEATDALARLLAGTGRPTPVRELIARLEQAATASAVEETEGAEVTASEAVTPAVPAAPPTPTGDTIRLPAARLDALGLQAEDFLGGKLAAGARVVEAAALVEAAARSRGLAEEGRALEARARDLLDHLRRDERAMAGAVDRLLDELRRLRMMPASTVLGPFPRMVRDLAQEQGKDVEWVVEGSALEVDRKVLEAMKDPLIHLVRNAVDHGVEPPADRRRAGKPARGRVTVAVTQAEGNWIEILVEDDGRGIDLARLRDAAVRARLLTAEAAQALSDDDALDLVYRSGLSTSPIITDVSGHGLGLAIVKERVERLGGRIRIETARGAGTTVRMTLPATIATFRGLLVRAGDRPFLLPAEAVERAARVGPGEIGSVEGRPTLAWNGRAIAVARLASVLGLPEREPGAEAGRQPCVVLRVGDERAGLLVEEVLGECEVLVKELRPPLVRVRNVAAVGLLGTGQVVLILRPPDLLASCRQRPRPSAPRAAREESRPPAAILVVDDSITTRTMEKNLLEAAGYQVRVAVDGAEAWTLLKTETFDLVVSDVDMPRMDGFELTSRIRADRKLGELPVVLVTALESREDRERGIEVGANAYVVKSSFDQSNLLEIIRRLV